MPTSIIKVPGGYQVVTPNHPKGHSLKPMTQRNAVAQKLIIDRAEGMDGATKYERYKKQREAGPG
jgi:hypothetical protein